MFDVWVLFFRKKRRMMFGFFQKKKNTEEKVSWKRFSFWWVDKIIKRLYCFFEGRFVVYVIPG